MDIQKQKAMRAMRTENETDVSLKIEGENNPVWGRIDQLKEMTIMK